MAVTSSHDDKRKALALAIAQIEKSHGKGSIMRLGTDSKVRVECIPTGAINLDAAIGIGGIPRGRITEIYGPESSGKTTLCLHVVANAQIGGWYEENGGKGYLYGVEMPADYAGPVPEGMILMDVPATEYVVFRHPPYDFDSQDAAVWKAIRKAVASYDPHVAGYAWNPAIPMWQRHDAAGMGQAWCRAVKKL